MKKRVLALCRLVVSWWSRFWFESDGYAQMRVFRFTLAWLLFFFYLTRLPDLRFFYSEEGIGNSVAYASVLHAPYRTSVFDYVPGFGAIVVGYFAHLAALLALAFGIWPRISAIIVFVLHISLMHRNMATVYGVDLVSTFFLFYFCFADFRAERKSGEVRTWLGSMSYRLCQLQVCVIYAYSGMEKLKGAQWWKGEAIWDVLANAQLARWDFSWAAWFPLPIVIATYLTLFWEIYFPIMVWVRKLRYPAIAFGVMLHIGIGLAMNIPYFGVLMILTYVLFLEPPLVRTLEEVAEKMMFWRKLSAVTEKA